jgi:hypothetical protein
MVDGWRPCVIEVAEKHLSNQLTMNISAQPAKKKYFDSNQTKEAPIHAYKGVSEPKR